MPNGHYILNERGEAIPCADILAWAKWFETADRKVALDKVGNMEVSTVFLGFDHGWNGKLKLYETMIFGQDHKEVLCWRYATRAQAKAGHERAVKLAKETKHGEST